MLSNLEGLNEYKQSLLRFAFVTLLASMLLDKQLVIKILDS
jgi:hypothetical protein